MIGVFDFMFSKILSMSFFFVSASWGLKKKNKSLKCEYPKKITNRT